MHHGTVQWYDDGWRSGMIRPDNSGKDVLFLQDAVEGGVQLSSGDRVEFKVVHNKVTWVRRLHHSKAGGTSVLSFAPPFAN